jgi:hypothetical protein
VQTGKTMFKPSCLAIKEATAAVFLLIFFFLFMYSMLLVSRIIAYGKGN